MSFKRSLERLLKRPLKKSLEKILTALSCTLLLNCGTKKFLYVEEIKFPYDTKVEKRELDYEKQKEEGIEFLVEQAKNNKKLKIEAKKIIYEKVLRNIEEIKYVKYVEGTRKVYEYEPPNRALCYTPIATFLVGGIVFPIGMITRNKPTIITGSVFFYGSLLASFYPMWCLHKKKKIIIKPETEDVEKIETEHKKVPVSIYPISTEPLANKKIIIKSEPLKIETNVITDKNGIAYINATNANLMALTDEPFKIFSNICDIKKVYDGIENEKVGVTIIYQNKRYDVEATIKSRDPKKISDALKKYCF